MTPPPGGFRWNPPHHLRCLGVLEQQAWIPSMDAFTNIQWGRFLGSGAENHRFASPRQVILAFDFRCFLNFAFWGRSEALWCPKTSKNRPQIHSKFDFCTTFFSNVFWTWFWCDLWLLQTQKTLILLRKNNDFHEICICKQSCQKHWFQGRFAT